MSLLDYKSVRPWAKAIQTAVLTRKMPPWFADSRYGHFANDARLDSKDIDVIVAWVASGAVEGDPKDLPPQPVFDGGWRLGKPDYVFDIGQDFKVAANKDLHVDFIVPTHFEKGVWIRAAQILPSNRTVVHHVHLAVIPKEREAKSASASRALDKAWFHVSDKTGLEHINDDAPVVNDGCKTDESVANLEGFDEGSFATLLPGKPPDVFDFLGDGSSAKFIPAGASLRFQIHYHNGGRPQVDRTSVGLYLASRVPDRPLKRTDLRNGLFLIPAGAPNQEVTRCYTLEADKLLVAITPHMHYRGKDARYELTHIDGRREVLLYVSHYDFGWQLQYRFKDPVLMEKGSLLQVTFHYDNSVNNPQNPDPNINVRWGEASEDEMMVTWMETLDGSPKSVQSERVR